MKTGRNWLLRAPSLARLRVDLDLSRKYRIDDALGVVLRFDRPPKPSVVRAWHVILRKSLMRKLRVEHVSVPVEACGEVAKEDVADLRADATKGVATITAEVAGRLFRGLRAPPGPLPREAIPIFLADARVPARLSEQVDRLCILRTPFWRCERASRRKLQTMALTTVRCERSVGSTQLSSRSNKR